MALAMCMALKCKFEDLFYAVDPPEIDRTHSFGEFAIH